MFEKLLLAATITFSLNLLIGMPSQSENQQMVATQSRKQPVQVAKTPDNSAPQREEHRPFFWKLF